MFLPTEQECCAALNDEAIEIPMTVAIAAICESNSMIVGAADRLLTVGDTQYESNHAKISSVTPSVAAMFAGTLSLEVEIRQRIKNKLESGLYVPSTVPHIVRLYCECYSTIRNEKAEIDILIPLGLDLVEFVRQQKHMDSQFIETIREKLTNFTLDKVEVLIVGVDTTGPHIYLAENQNIYCQDSAGYGVIGTGAGACEKTPHIL